MGFHQPSTGAIYQYYQHVTNRRRGGCKKKYVKKVYIEDLVVNETIRILTPEYIEKIARSIEDLCERERNTENLKRINKLIRENDKATENLVKAIEAGKAVDVISAQIEKRQKEKAELEAQLAMEKIQRPVLKYEQIRFSLSGLSAAISMTSTTAGRWWISLSIEFICMMTA